MDIVEKKSRLAVLMHLPNKKTIFALAGDEERGSELLVLLVDYDFLYIVAYKLSKAMGVETIKLSSGGCMPVLGLGTWLSTDEGELTAALRTALDSGYRLIDTAFVYQNEAVIGNVLQEYFKSGKLKREDIFITSKLPLTAHAPEDVEKCLNMQLKALQIDYLDLYLVHCPLPFQKENDSFAPAFVNDMQVPIKIDHVDTWHAMEKMYDAGKCKVECHLYWPQTELYELCKKLNISFTAYGPLGSPGRKAFNPNMKWPEGNPLSDPEVKELAAKHNKTPAQILLRHLIQRGMAVIPKSVKPERVKENMAVFDFTLSQDEMNKLNSVKTRMRLFLFDFAIGHPFYPFEEVDQSKLKMVSLKS
ncbi:oxidoreductase, aldo/keto reductase family protein [Ancylostoma ceylanicum]|uniref:Oxidoreductase, aldo/keto reductase family protein n=1 Tax=Ancylostoma ceylanicum TaxID=53326 RepID=A0A0D6L5N2_9BILA|nr:oxidoreductase, aldo/keto reductase family protein [Ancylostoma ceylanicum]